VNAPDQSHSLSTRLRILLSEGLKLFAIAVGCLVVFAIAFFVWIKTGLIRFHIPARWFGLFYWTCFLVWFICRQLKRDLRRAKFWGALLAFVAIHVGAFVVVLRSYPEWRAIWFMLIALIEFPLIALAVQSIVETSHRR
jgi:hypothetical protein